MLIASRRLSTSTLLSDSLRYASSWRFFSTSFREERDTFGPILVPDDKYVFSIYLCLLISMFVSGLPECVSILLLSYCVYDFYLFLEHLIVLL